MSRECPPRPKVPSTAAPPARRTAAAQQGIDRLVEQDRGVLQGLVHTRPLERKVLEGHRACRRLHGLRPPWRRTWPCPRARSGCPCQAARPPWSGPRPRATRGRRARAPCRPCSTSMALPRKMRFHHCADMGSWPMRSRNITHSGRGNSIRQPWGCLVMVIWPRACAVRASRCRVGIDNRPLASRLSDDAPWNTNRYPCLIGLTPSQGVSAERHFSPLNCTFLHCSRKTTPINRAVTKFVNEINDLERRIESTKNQAKSFTCNHLSHLA